jgi:hypothetical protein
MEETLKTNYGEDGVVVVNTRGLSTADIVRRIAQIIHVDEYDKCCDLHGRLEEIEGGGMHGQPG